jgi:hypothetical protein
VNGPMGSRTLLIQVFPFFWDYDKSSLGVNTHSLNCQNSDMYLR